MRSSNRILRVAFLIPLFLLISSLISLDGFTLPAGFQEFYVPLPADLARQIFVNIDNNPAVSTGMHYVVGVTASADNTTVYYDHWENGLLTGAAGDQVVNLNKGQVYYFESSNIPSSPRGTGTYYDGGDRIFVAGSLLQLVVSIWPESPGTVFTDAWEVYPVQAWENTYVIPVGENLAGAPTNYIDFAKVWLLVMSGSDGNSITITDPAGPGLSTTLNRGKTAIYEVRGAGTTVSGSGKIQVQLMTGRFNSGTSSEMRGYTMTPRAYWGTSYYSPVPSWPAANTDLFLYNPNSFAITINFQDLSGSGSFTIPAGGTRSYRDGTGRYVPVGSGVYLSSSSTFWGIVSGDTRSATWDWGCALIPVNFLTTDNYVSWAPGTGQAVPTSNGSPVYVTAITDNTTVFVDYGPNDGVFDAIYTLNSLQVIQIRDPDNNNTGMHIVSTSPVAVAWGESPDYAGTGAPYLDMGYTTLPLPVEWIDVALLVEKSVDPAEVEIDEEAEFTVVISVPSTATQATNVDLVDKLPPGWVYVTGSGNPSDPTSITGNLGSGYTLTWDANWTINPGESRTVRFRARATSSADTTNPNRNVASATGQSLGATLTADDDAFIDVLSPPRIIIDKDVVTNPPVVGPGTQVTYQIRVANVGESTARNVSIWDPLPDSFTYNSTDDITETGGATRTSISDPVSGDSTPTWGFWNIPPGGSVTITFTVDIPDTITPGSYEDTAYADGDNFTEVNDLGDQGQDSDTPDGEDPEDDEDVIVLAGCVVIDKDILTDPPLVAPGGQVTYRIRVINTNTALTIVNLRIWDILPPGFSYDHTDDIQTTGATRNYVEEPSPGATEPWWGAWRVLPGGSVTVIFTVNVAVTVPDGTYDNTAYSRCFRTDPPVLVNDDGEVGEDPDTIPGQDPENDEDVTIQRPKMTIDKDAIMDEPVVAPGGQAIYEIKVVNNDTGAAIGVYIRDILPAGFSYASTESISELGGATRTTTLDPAPGDTTLTWGYWTIPSGGSVTIRFVVNVATDVPNGTYDNIALAGGDNFPEITDDGTIEQDPNTPPGEDPEDDEDITVQRPNMTIDKDVVMDEPVVEPGGQVIYQISVVNNDTGAAIGVYIRDILPAGFSYASTTSINELGGATRAETIDPAPGDTTPTWGYWTIPSGGSVTIRFVVNVATDVPNGTYDNTAIAGGDNFPEITDDGTVAQDPNTPPGEDPEDDEDITVERPTIGGDPPIYKNIVAFPTPELHLGIGPNRDLNRDGDFQDCLLRYKNIDTGVVVNTGLAVSCQARDIDIYEDWIVFVGERGEIRYYNITTRRWGKTGAVGSHPSIFGKIIAFSTTDNQIAYFDVEKGELISLGLEGSEPVIHGHFIAFTSGQTIRYYDLLTGEATDTGAVGQHPSIYGNIIAFSTEERSLGADLNGDGDVKDWVIRYFDLARQSLTNTGAVGTSPAIYGKYIAFETEERAHGADLNGDGDIKDIVISYYDIELGQVFTTGRLGMEPDIYENVISFWVFEPLARLDLNGDGDRSDPIVQVYRIEPQAQIEPLVIQAILSYPNPARHSVRFAVQGEGIRGISVQIYNLAGRKIYDSGPVSGNELFWPVIDQAGRPVANGVYFYIVTVRGAVTAKQSAVGKLVLLR